MSPELETVLEWRVRFPSPLALIAQQVPKPDPVPFDRVDSIPVQHVPDRLQDQIREVRVVPLVVGPEGYGLLQDDPQIRKGARIPENTGDAP